MPDSARRALKKAQENGHILFICTGRGKAQIYPFLMDFGFDGIIAGAGAYVEYKDRVLIHNVYGKERVQKVVDLFTGYDMAFMLQMTEGCVMTRRGMIRFVQSLGFDVKEDQFEEIRGIIERSLGSVILDDEVETFSEKYQNTENVLYTNSPLSVPEMQEKVGNDLKVMPPSFSNPKPDQGEITLSGVAKDLALRWTADAIGVDVEDTVAFGDGANDVSMLRAAGTGVAMGNAISKAKEAADFVTKDIDDGGIEYAMQKLGLI